MLVVLSSNTFSGRGTNGALEGFLLGELLSVCAREKERGGCDMIHNGVNVATVAWVLAHVLKLKCWNGKHYDQMVSCHSRISNHERNMWQGQQYFNDRHGGVRKLSPFPVRKVSMAGWPSPAELRATIRTSYKLDGSRSDKDRDFSLPGTRTVCQLPTTFPMSSTWGTKYKGTILRIYKCHEPS